MSYESLPDYMEPGSMNDDPLTKLLVDEGAYADVHDRVATLMAAQMQVVLHDFIENACDEMRARLNVAASKCVVTKYKTTKH